MIDLNKTRLEAMNFCVGVLRNEQAPLTDRVKAAELIIIWCRPEPNSVLRVQQVPPDREPVKQ